MVDGHGISPLQMNSDGSSAWSFHYIWGTHLQVPKRRAIRANGLSMNSNCYVTCKDPPNSINFIFDTPVHFHLPSSEQLDLIRWLIYRHTCFAFDFRTCTGSTTSSYVIWMWVTSARALQAKETGNRLFQEGICQRFLCSKGNFWSVRLLFVYMESSSTAPHILGRSGGHGFASHVLTSDQVAPVDVNKAPRYKTGGCSSDRQDRGQRKAGKRAGPYI